MSLTIRAILCLVALAVTVAAGPAGGQSQVATPATTPAPAFPKLFANYTGLNGYEDLVLAGDIVSGNAAVQAAEQGEATLKQMRDMLDDRDVERALQMVRLGLDKQVQSPRDPNKSDEQTLLPEYAGFRRLARVMAMEEYVALADGRVQKAIDVMRDGLRLGYIVQSEFLISGLVGIAIDSIALTTIARHFDQMSLKDCIHVTAIAREWLKLPSPAEAVYESEQRTLRNMLNTWKGDPARLRAIIKDQQPANGPTSDSEAAAVELSSYVETHPNLLMTLIDQTEALAEVEHAVLMQDVRRPAWQRKTGRNRQPRVDMAHRLYSMIAPTDLALAKYDLDRTQIHLLGVHGAIRRFRWENNHLPASLDDLKLPALIVDPFTGATLTYKPSGSSYELYSTGPAGGEAGAAIGAVHLPRNP